MMHLTQKDKNILNRFESESKGSKAKKYTVHMNNGSVFQMVCMNNESIDEATESCKDRFLSEFSHVEE